MATKREEQLSPEEEAKARDMKRARLLANGISDEAMAILEEHVGLHLPVFQISPFLSRLAFGNPPSPRGRGVNASGV